MVQCVMETYIFVFIEARLLGPALPVGFPNPIGERLFHLVGMAESIGMRELRAGGALHDLHEFACSTITRGTQAKTS